MKLQNRTILITGGTSGIGLELVRQLISSNSIIITGRDVTKLQDVKKQFPKVNIIESDVSNSNDIKKLYAYIEYNFPQLNVLINNAGVMRNINFQNNNMDLEDITQEIETNLSGTIRMVHQFLPLLKMQASAAIINISSSLAFIPFPVSPVYSASKAGVRSFTQVLRLQLQDTEIKVFEIAPPQTDTHLSDEFTDLDTEGSGPIMKVENMVKESIAGIESVNFEIKPGLSKVFKWLSRIAPDFTLRMFDNTLKKGIERKRKLKYKVL